MPVIISDNLAVHGLPPLVACAIRRVLLRVLAGIFP
jgi:hypothetical protein